MAFTSIVEFTPRSGLHVCYNRSTVVLDKDLLWNEILCAMYTRIEYMQQSTCREASILWRQG
jgi:hypothetical protein